MSMVTIEEAQAKLPEIIDKLLPGEELIITRNDEPVVRLVGSVAPAKSPRKLGTLRGTVLHIAPDFDAPLEGFKEYME